MHIHMLDSLGLLGYYAWLECVDVWTFHMTHIYGVCSLVASRRLLSSLEPRRSPVYSARCALVFLLDMHSCFRVSTFSGMMYLFCSIIGLSFFFWFWSACMARVFRFGRVSEKPVRTVEMSCRVHCQSPLMTFNPFSTHLTAGLFIQSGCLDLPPPKCHAVISLHASTTITTCWFGFCYFYLNCILRVESWFFVVAL